MSNFSVKNASLGLTIAASALCLGGILSFYRVDEKTKPLALNIAIAASAIATSSLVSSNLCDKESKDQAHKLVQQHKTEFNLVEKDRDDLGQKLTKQTSALNEVKILNEKQEQTILEVSTELQVKNSLVTALQAELIKVRKEVDSKLLQDDNRYETTVYLLKCSFQESLREKIDENYERLADSISSNLSNENYQGIHPQLQHLYNSLTVRRNTHYLLLNQIAEIEDDIAAHLTSIYFQVTDEISSLKVRYRNVVNLDERLMLQMASEELIERRDLKKFIPKPKVDTALDIYQQSQKQDLAKIKNIANQNSQELQELKDEVDTFISQLEEKHGDIAKLQQQIEELQKPYQFYGGSTIPKSANKVGLYYFKTYGYKLDGINWEETPTGYQITYGIRNNPALTEKEMYADNSREQLAAFTNSLHGTLPSFNFNYQNCTLILTVVLRSAPKKVVTPEDLVIEIKNQLQPSDSLINFVRDSYHIGMWGETGRGKTTAISNTIGGMIQELGTPTIRTTVPKIDADTAKMFPSVDWLGVPNSIFGLLEAALEIQYRISKNEEAFTNGQEVKDFDPIIFFIDEINLIFSRWRKVNDADLDNVLGRFADTLKGERLEYFNEFMQIELRNYKNEFAKKLLMFIWQTGRSLRVKSLIAGQNLQPGAFGVFVNDIANCAYIAFGDSKEACAKYKVKSSDLDAINSQLNLLGKAEKTDKQLQFTGLFCPSVGSAFLSVLPAPNTYEWDKSILSPNSPKTLDFDPDRLDSGLNKVQASPALDAINSSAFERFGLLDQLPEQYQKLDYGGLVQLWLKLPKKQDGTIHKTQAYEKVFNVSKSTHRKLYSEFIDYLEKFCK